MLRRKTILVITLLAGALLTGCRSPFGPDKGTGFTALLTGPAPEAAKAEGPSGAAPPAESGR